MMRPGPREDGWRGLRRVFRLPWSPGRMRDEIDEELRFHLEGRIEQLVEREGLSRAAAEREARRRFGDLNEYRRQTRTIDQDIHRRRQRMALLETLNRETRQAVRTLRRTPSFSLMAVTTLALGLGAATAMFTLLDRVVLRPLPYATADRLLHLGTLMPMVKEGAEFGISRAQFFEFKQKSHTIAELGVYDQNMLIVPGDGVAPAERVPALATSATLFEVLGIRPERGRLYRADENRIARGADATVAVISHDYWMRRFGGDDGVVGKRLDLGDRSLEIVGVLPRDAGVPGAVADIWYPDRLEPSDPPYNNHVLHAIALLQRGATVETAAAELKRIEVRFEDANPRVYSPRFRRGGFALNVTALRDSVLGSTISRALWILFAAVGLVLLIAAANVANLFLVRIDARRRETAVRTAIGAERTHLAMHFLAESLVLAFAASILALVVAAVLLKLVLPFAPPGLPRLTEVALDGRGAGFCVGVSLLSGIAFALLPLAGRSVDLALLREGGRGLTTSRAHIAARAMLVVTQVAMAVVLLAGAGLLLESFTRLRSVRPGFDPDGVLAMSIYLRPDVYDPSHQDEGRAVSFWRELTRRVEALPGVTSAGAVDVLPLADGAGCTGITALITATRDSIIGACIPTVLAAPGYFDAMRIHVQGQKPDWSSTEGRTAGAVISRALAKRLWNDANPLGKELIYSPRRAVRFQIVGIADDVLGDGLRESPVEYAYLPIAATDSLHTPMDVLFLRFIVRAPARDLGQLAAEVRRVVRDIDPRVAIGDVVPMETVVAKSMAQNSFAMLLLAIAAGMALVLSGVGIYGVISYIVAQRRSEIGIRIALGAQVSQVAGMVMQQSLRVALVGVAIGLVGALAGTRLLRSLLFGVSPTDPLVLVSVAVVLLAIAAAASLAPARRAARFDPVEAMHV